MRQVHGAARQGIRPWCQHNKELCPVLAILVVPIACHPHHPVFKDGPLQERCGSHHCQCTWNAYMHRCSPQSTIRVCPAAPRVTPVHPGRQQPPISQGLDLTTEGEPEKSWL